jgi:glutamate synthase domain-containing protein 2
MRNRFLVSSALVVICLLVLGSVWHALLWWLLLVIPVVLLGVYDIYQSRHTVWRNFPVIGHMRRILEALRIPIHQYFIESETGGVPLNRMYRSLVYQRAKGEPDTIPLGTKVDVYSIGYEWMDHSLAALPDHSIDPDLRVVIGGPQCDKPYSASLLNISAMSFGALSDRAILALNSGASIGGFAHNTGEGSISPYHQQAGGDLTWQIGTGYFGCRTLEGEFCPASFTKKAQLAQVKMIEIKLSQGAKPGHGGILPASKNSAEIAEIRLLTPHTEVNSPAAHSRFSTPIELMGFVQQLRVLSNGKPVGFKLCVGRRSEFVAICKAMIETGILPDFITVDGGEGGTGAAPLEYANSVGMPLRESVAFVVDCLVGFDLKKDIRVIASGKILTGFHMIQNMALGADLCNSARGMMLALGCIQSLECNKNSCPTGIATQNPALAGGLDVTNKKQRVANYHHQTMKSVAELFSAAGIREAGQLRRSHIHQRISATETARYDQIFPPVEPGCLLKPPYPKSFEYEMDHASAGSFNAQT